MIQDLKNCLAYCREQNGMNQCKNCGLSQEMIDGVNQEHKAELEMIKGEIDERSYGTSDGNRGDGDVVISLSETQAILDSHINKLTT